jgi:hypothetical protein
MKVNFTICICAMIVGILSITMTSMAHAKNPKILVIGNYSEQSKPSDQYAIQGFLSAWCGKEECLNSQLSFPVTSPQVLSFSIDEQTVELQLIDNSLISYSDMMSDTQIIAIAVFESDFFDKMTSTVPLPALTVAPVTVPLNFINSSRLVSLLPNDIQIASAMYRLLSDDDRHRFAMVYEPNSQNMLLFSSLLNETDNYQRMGTGINLDGSPNTNKLPLQLTAGFPIYDQMVSLFDFQKGLSATISGKAFNNSQTEAIVFMGTSTSLSALHESLSDTSLPFYGTGSLMNDDILNLPNNIQIQLIVPALASDRSALETDHANTFQTNPPFHFIVDYGYDAGLFLKALVEQQVISKTSLDKEHTIESATSFVSEGITGPIGMNIKNARFSTIARKCSTNQNCQWEITSKTIEMYSKQISETADKMTESVSNNALKKQNRSTSKIVCFFPETKADLIDIDMAQQIKKGFQLATSNAPFSIEYIDSYGDPNVVRSLIYGNPHYQITQKTLSSIEQDDVPINIIEALSSILDQDFETESDLMDQLISLIGAEATQIHGGIISYHAYVGDGYYDLSDILAVVTLKSAITEAITILPEKRDILVLGPASDAICNVRDNIINFFLKDEQITEFLENRLLKLSQINTNMHRYITIVYSDPLESPSTQSIFHKLFSNHHLFESIIQQYKGCDPRQSEECNGALYPQWIGILPFYDTPSTISLVNTLESLKEDIDHLIFMGNATSFKFLLTELFIHNDLRKKLWTAAPGLDHPSVPQKTSIGQIRLQAMMTKERKPNDVTQAYTNQFFNEFGYIPGRFEDIGYDMGLFLSTTAQQIQNENKNLNRSSFLNTAQQLNYTRFIDTCPQWMILKNGQWMMPAKFDFNQDGQTSISDALFLLKKFSGEFNGNE